MTTAGVLLAAGRSRRFGDANKLLSQYCGSPLVSYVASAMRYSGVDHLIAVVSCREVAAELDDFRHVWPTDGESSLSASIRAGIVDADLSGADRALIVLGDMPGVTSGHLSLLIEKCSVDKPSATINGTQPMVPACFPSSLFPQLMRLEGDAGARKLLEEFPIESVVPANVEELIDLDLPEDFCNREGMGGRA